MYTIISKSFLGRNFIFHILVYWSKSLFYKSVFFYNLFYSKLFLDIYIFVIISKYIRVNNNNIKLFLHKRIIW